MAAVTEKKSIRVQLKTTSFGIPRRKRQPAGVAGAVTPRSKAPDPPNVLGQPHEFLVDEGYVNLKGRRVSVYDAVKKSLPEQVSWRKSDIAEISSILPSESHYTIKVKSAGSVMIDGVKQTLIEIETWTPTQDVSLDQRSSSRRMKSAGDRANRDRLSVRERMAVEDAMMRKKLENEPITPEQEEIFDQAFASLHHDPI